jgi:predicted DNA-binding transcriptional regulator AlpA
MEKAPSTKPQHDGKDLLFYADLERLTALNKHTLYRYSRMGKMPAPIKFGSQLAWYECDILAWIKIPSINKKIAWAKCSLIIRPASNDEHYSEGGNV